MNIKFASLSLIITAVAGLGFVQSANANDEDGQPEKRPTGRFQYAGNLFQLDPTTGGGRRFKPLPYAKASAPSSGPTGSVTPGSVPKMALDPTFLAPAKPIPTVPTIAPIVKATILPVKPAFTAIPSSSPFKSIFGNPQPLVAKMEKPLSPMTQQPQQPSVPPAMHANKSGTARLLTPQPRRYVASHAPAATGGIPATQTYGAGNGYQFGTTLPTTVGNGNSVNTSVIGVIKKH
jgi:hypothetical protein